MSVGDKIKQFRIKENLTQKDLSEKLNVTYQTISKWESDINEPDIKTLKEMASIFSCSIDELLGEEKSKEETNETKKKNAVCDECGCNIEGESHVMSFKSSSGLPETKEICDNCYSKHETLITKREALFSEFKRVSKVEDDLSKNELFIYSFGAGIALLIFTLLLVIKNAYDWSIGARICASILIPYAAIADVYCILSDSFVGDVFEEIATWSVKFPGVIFSFDLEGLGFLIVVKLLFFILGIFISIAVFCLALIVSAFVSIFVYPFIVFKR